MDVAVLGAGDAGRGVAQVCAIAGHDVHLHGDDANAVMDGIDSIEAAIGNAVDAGDLAGDQRDAVVERIDGTTGLEAAVAGADVVVETTDRGRDRQRELFAEVEEHVSEETLVATSASAVSVTAIAAGLRQPGRAVGLHFVDPPRTPLIEVVVADQTTEAARAAAVDFVDSLDRESVVVHDAPGFAATRLSLALSVEAMRMVETGVAGVESIDRAMELGHDHPVGPLAAADRAGLDARLSELEYLARELGARFDPPSVLREKVAAGDLGRKTGEGFYVWEGGEPAEPAEPDPRPALREDSPPDPDGV